VSEKKRIGNLGQRVLIAVVGIPMILAMLYQSSWMLVAASILTVVATLEMLTLWGKGKSAPNPLVPLLTAILLPLTFHYFPGRFDLIVAVLLTTSVLALLFELFRSGSDSLRTTAAYFHLTWFAIVPLSLLVPLRQQPHGVHLLLLVFLTAWAIDTGAYFVGKSIGRHKFFPSISPKKTVEGWVGGTVVGLLVVWGCTYIMDMTPLTHWSTGGAVLLLGPAGDLVESRFKRAAGVKDVSRFLPGHGGFLDRFDTITLALPVIFLLQLLKP
jgi:phosphatidate cytidylyltransferase